MIEQFDVIAVPHPQPTALGYYEFGGVQLHITKRPHRLARIMSRVLLDWRWHDEETR